MNKIPDMYIEVDPWLLIESNFHPDRSRVSESLFSISNEYLGERGYFEEGYSGDSLPGTYLNGVFEERFTEKSAYKGISDRLCFMVNSADWLYVRISVDGELLDLNTVQFEDFKRTLNLKTGEICREYKWTTSSGKSTSCLFKRFVSMDSPEFSYQQISLKPLNWSGEIVLKTGIDYSLKHEGFKHNFWKKKQAFVHKEGGEVCLETEKTDFPLYLGYSLSLSGAEVQGDGEDSENIIATQFILAVEKQEEITLNKGSVIYKAARNRDDYSKILEEGRALVLKQKIIPYKEALLANSRYWEKIWNYSNISIEGDPINQQGIRFCIFQLNQTYTGYSSGSNIGAKGLTGEAYNGNAFWDTETYCLPYYIFNNPKAARSLMEYRYKTLDAARMRAKDLDCEGACYPVATMDGTESCTLWQHASLQFQPTTSVGFALEHYFLITGDKNFLLEKGLEVLLEISRFLSSRCQWSPGKKAYGFYGVMGPDEFQMMVNHNCYTNYMAKKNLEFTLSALEMLRVYNRTTTNEILHKVNFKEAEAKKWANIADKMYIPFNPESLLFEQHEGFFDLPHIEIDKIPLEDFPLYHHWSYDRIYRNDMIKQPDVLMFMLLYNQSFSREEKLVNYDFYEPKCIHESSLSPSVHSILALELGKYTEALDFFRFATRIDLDNYNRNTREGLHLTAIAAAWMNIVYGFIGLRSDGPLPSIDPVLPENWASLSVSLNIKGRWIDFKLTLKQTQISLREGDPLEIIIKDKHAILNHKGITLPSHIAVSHRKKI